MKCNRCVFRQLSGERIFGVEIAYERPRIRVHANIGLVTVANAGIPFC